MPKFVIYPQKDTSAQLAEARAVGLKFDSPRTLETPVTFERFDNTTKTWVVKQD